MFLDTRLLPVGCAYVTVSRSCLPTLCCSTGDIGWVVSGPCPFLTGPGVVLLQYSASLWRYPASPLSLQAQCGIVAVFGFTVVVSCFAHISSRPAWYRCGIWLRCSGILLRPYLLLVLTGGGRSPGSRR